MPRSSAARVSEAPISPRRAGSSTMAISSSGSALAKSSARRPAARITSASLPPSASTNSAASCRRMRAAAARRWSGPGSQLASPVPSASPGMGSPGRSSWTKSSARITRPSISASALPSVMPNSRWILRSGSSATWSSMRVTSEGARSPSARRKAMSGRRANMACSKAQRRGVTGASGMAGESPRRGWAASRSLCTAPDEAAVSVSMPRQAPARRRRGLPPRRARTPRTAPGCRHPGRTGPRPAPRRAGPAPRRTSPARPGGRPGW